VSTTQPIRRYTINVTITEPRDPDDGPLSVPERARLERKIIKLLGPLDGDVDAEVMTVEDTTETIETADPWR
jgi:hypothetical protein